MFLSLVSFYRKTNIFVFTELRIFFLFMCPHHVASILMDEKPVCFAYENRKILTIVTINVFFIYHVSLIFVPGC